MGWILFHKYRTITLREKGRKVKNSTEGFKETKEKQ